MRAVAARWWAKPLPAEPLSAVEAPPKAGAVRAARGANGCFVGGMRGLCTDLQATRETSSEELVSARYGELMKGEPAINEKPVRYDTTRHAIRHEKKENFSIFLKVRQPAIARKTREATSDARRGLWPPAAAQPSVG